MCVRFVASLHSRTRRVSFCLHTKAVMEALSLARRFVWTELSASRNTVQKKLYLLPGLGY